jgi:hypothetical protein
MIHEYLLKMRKSIDWAKANPVHKGPRWGVIVVDNVHMGWADISYEPRIEAYFTVYVVDLWRVYHCCSFQADFQLYEVNNVVFFKDKELPDDEIQEVEDRWVFGQDQHNPLVAVRDIERDNSSWVLVDTYDDDGEPDGDDSEYMKKVDQIIDCECSNPTFC